MRLGQEKHPSGYCVYCPTVHFAFLVLCGHIFKTFFRLFLYRTPANVTGNVHILSSGNLSVLFTHTV